MSSREEKRRSCEWAVSLPGEGWIPSLALIVQELVQNLYAFKRAVENGLVNGAQWIYLLRTFRGVQAKVAVVFGKVKLHTSP